MENQAIAKGVDSVQEEGLAITIPKELDPTRGSGNVWVSLTPKTDLDRARIMTALQGQIPRLGDIIGHTIMAENVAFQTVDVTDKKTGEVFQAIRSVIFCVGGDMFSAVSDGVRASLGMTCRLFGYPPWNPAIPFKVAQINTGQGRRFYVLNVDEAALAKRKAK